MLKYVKYLKVSFDLLFNFYKEKWGLIMDGIKNLYDVEVNNSYTVVEVPDNDLIKTLGVFEGSQVFKKLVYGLGGPVLLDIDGRDVAIGKDFSVLIKVSEVK